MNFYFDGYCPESLLKGRQVEMRLNEDDFWESEATGLQIAVLPPYATILRWRGKGKFRPSSGMASDVLTGLVLAGAQKEEGKEILPDRHEIIGQKEDLIFYLDEVYNSKEALEAAKFDDHDPALKKQEAYLETLPKEDLEKLIGLFERIEKSGSPDRYMNTESFQQLHKMLYDLKLIFDFKWMDWEKGWKDINNKGFDFSKSTLLDISMYLTVIFRSDRFCDGNIEGFLRDGMVGRIFEGMKMKLLE